MVLGKLQTAALRREVTVRPISLRAQPKARRTSHTLRITEIISRITPFRSSFFPLPGVDFPASKAATLASKSSTPVTSSSTEVTTILVTYSPNRAVHSKLPECPLRQLQPRDRITTSPTGPGAPISFDTRVGARLLAFKEAGSRSSRLTRSIAWKGLSLT